MKSKDYAQRTKIELSELLVERRARAEELSFLLSQKKVKNVKELREVRKDVARILTVLQKEYTL
ncbi:MAG: 50S ribosomal protein L29 [Candidatus Sungbacteria bacterium GWC2_49_10]|uniref:Large ribosomal subunit protein uL29 n=2 Tax=Parcubacteria group TaxID=1794811 RepID=A0A0G1ZPE6_9BACT|nr:MAG: hypothetical protein UY60_C0005G0019 [Parcubacteria group bacterium GW2011_GWB1_50_9]KKW21309.1 MAG: hypothetical protein UY61_C0009G0004 [Candidatus Adlerbacteria bacterium GW2011_GWC1_50_9]KKW33825.1 MAG: hypothetical protein UY78_C0002G0022 [Parcubacteria group bacterium GW2011_GWA1_53_13]OGZ93389.1 MAG: 50S ribosomal protein L29 [Candidatus Sungbacteria bacterium GWC2_49_10]